MSAQAGVIPTLPKVAITIELDAAQASTLDALRVEAGVSRPEMARRLVTPMLAISEVPAGLTQRETIIFKAVSRSMPNGISREQLVDRVYAADPNGGPEWAINCVTVAIVNLNRKLRARKIKVTARGCGRVYRLKNIPENADA